MHKKFLVLALFAMAFSVANAQTKKKTYKKAVVKETGNLMPKTFADSVSYAIGVSVASFYKNIGAKDINTVYLSEAVKKVFKGEETGFTEQQIQSLFMRAESAFNAEKAAKAKAESKVFLDKNKAKSGVVTLPSGLQYEVITVGTGDKPSAQDTVVCNYKGTLIDGTEFDNSYKRGQPITIPVNGVIKGWTEALQLMPVGSKWKLYIPSELGYGDRGAGAQIPPGAALVFDVELISLKKNQKNQ